APARTRHDLRRCVPVLQEQLERQPAPQGRHASRLRLREAPHAPLTPAYPRNWERWKSAPQRGQQLEPRDHSHLIVGHRQILAQPTIPSGIDEQQAVDSLLPSTTAQKPTGCFAYSTLFNLSALCSTNAYETTIARTRFFRGLAAERSLSAVPGLLCSRMSVMRVRRVRGLLCYAGLGPRMHPR